MNPSAQVERIRRAAVAVQLGHWQVSNLTLVPAGNWSVRVEVLVSNFKKPILEGTVELR